MAANYFRRWIDRALVGACVVAASVMSASVVDAAAFGINVIRTGGAEIVTADAFGVATADWINLPGTGPNQTYGPFTIDGGSVTVVTTGPGYWNMGGSPSPDGDRQVTYGYLDDGGDNGNSLSISGMSSILATGQTYSIAVVMASDAANAFSDVRVSGSGDETLGTLVQGTLVSVPEGAYTITSTLAGLDGDYVKVSSKRSDPVNANIRGTIAGVVITIVPEPASVGVLAIGALGLLVRRRKSVV